MKNPILLFVIILIGIGCNSCTNEEGKVLLEKTYFKVEVTSHEMYVQVDVTFSQVDDAMEYGIYWKADYPALSPKIDMSNAVKVVSQQTGKTQTFLIFPWDNMHFSSWRDRDKCRVFIQAYASSGRQETVSSCFHEVFSAPIVPSVEECTIIDEEVHIRGSIQGKYMDQIEESGVYWWVGSGIDSLEGAQKVVFDETPEDFSFSFPLPQLGKETHINCVSYARTSHGTFYSKEKSGYIPFDVKAIIYPSFIDMTFESITLIGNCTTGNEALYPLLEYGFCYLDSKTISTDRMPDINDGKLIVGNGKGGRFEGTLTELNPGSVYRIRAYSLTSRGVKYSSTYVTVPLHSPINYVPYSTMQSVITNPNVPGQVTLKGRIDMDRGYLVEERGFCYNTSGKEPTLNDRFIAVGNGVGEYSVTVDLPPGRYTFKTYGINKAGTGYSYGFKEVYIE